MLCVACGMALAVISPATASAPALAAGPGKIRVGVAPLLPAGARVLGALGSATELNVTVALAPRDPAALSAFAGAVSTPGSSVYRQYITPAQFADRFGPTATQITAVEDSLRAHGLQPGALSANGLSIRLSATAGAIERALSLSLDRLALPGSATAIVNRAAPALDAGIAHLVQGVVGLDNLATPMPLLIHRAALPRAHPQAHPHVVTGGPQPCATASAAAPSQSAYTADQIASAYGFGGLYQAGDQGQGQTIALYELEPNDPADIAAFQACYGTHASVSYVPVDGGAGSGPGSGEAALDIESAISLAPRARFLVYQAPNSNSSAPGAGPYDEFSAIVSQDQAHVVSASWGQCEAVEGSGNAAAEATLFQEAAAQGQTFVAASGDNGSEDCFAGQLLSGMQLAVDDPASQPFVTGVGGTSLNSLGPRPGETVWNAGGSFVAATLTAASGAGGGGVSGLWRMPAYQTGAASSLHVIGAGSSSSFCGGGSALCRQVPDVSADANPNTGYLIYWNGTASVSGQPAGWQTIGGTSLSAPMWAALLALANASPACGGSPVGFANPALYRAAATASASDFNDVSSGNNDFTGTNGSKYVAGPGYDMASGLGTPNAAALVATLCADSLRLINPGARSSTVHTHVSYQVRTAAAAGRTVTFSARGLPTGLTINPGTGQISGKPRRTGTSTVTIHAGQDLAVAETSFRWTIGGPPSISHVSLTGVGQGRPVLRLSVSSGRRAPEAEALFLLPSAGLRFAANGRRIKVTGPGGRRLRFRAVATRGTLIVILRAPAPRFRITVSYAAITADRSLVARVVSGRARTERVSAAITDSSGGVTTLRIRAKPSG
jgi:subtilase family serine protease